MTIKNWIANSLCALAFFSSGLVADSSRENAAELIAAVQQQLVLDEVVSGDFQQDKYIAVLPQPLRSEGRFRYDPEQGLEWETLRPVANRLTFSEQGIVQSLDGEVVWQVDGSQPAVLTISQVISSVLALDWNRLQDYFQLKGQADAGAWQLVLEPRDTALKQFVETIAISGNQRVEALSLLEANGDRTEIRFLPSGALAP